MKALLASALTLAASVAAADTVTLTEPMAAASLRTGQVDMVVYFTEGDAAKTVVATYVTDAEPAAPKRLILSLADGDATRFGLPGQHGQSYSFARTGDVVEIGGTLTATELAMN
ncbi:hypothetical protein [Litorisediminicola beolgyonensis]|uniref:Uncharacterized protein n=1 Tax=Litorisediminicola beolgyonensis TaxID=1173614 RepID=A0ABW3ZCX6_9RHOB